MLLCEFEDMILDFLLLGIPMFLLGNVTMLVFLMDKKYEYDENHQRIRKKRIKYINYLEGILVKKRREQQKIDID